MDAQGEFCCVGLGTEIPSGLLVFSVKPFDSQSSLKSTVEIPTQEHVLRLISSFSPVAYFDFARLGLLVDPMTLPIQSPLTSHCL